MNSLNAPPILNTTVFWEGGGGYQRGWLWNTWCSLPSKVIRMIEWGVGERGNKQVEEREGRNLGDWQHMDKERSKRGQHRRKIRGKKLFHLQKCSKTFRVKRLKVWSCKTLTSFIPRVPLLVWGNRSPVQQLGFYCLSLNWRTRVLQVLRRFLFCFEKIPLKQLIMINLVILFLFAWTKKQFV